MSSTRPPRRGWCSASRRPCTPAGSPHDGAARHQGRRSHRARHHRPLRCRRHRSGHDHDRPAEAPGVGVRRHVPAGWRRRGWRLRRVTTVLPTDVLTVGDDMYLHVMVCRELGNVRWTELHRSRDGGRTWRPTGTRWPADLHGGLFQMLTWERGTDGWVYALTTGFQRAHGLLLHRVPETALTDPAAWQAWGLDGDRWGWGNPPTLVLDGKFGELSLRRMPDDGCWLLSTFDDGHYRIDVRVLDGPTADLHVAPLATVMRGCGWDGEDHARGHVAQLYGGGGRAPAALCRVCPRAGNKE